MPPTAEPTTCFASRVPFVWQSVAALDLIRLHFEGCDLAITEGLNYADDDTGEDICVRTGLSATRMKPLLAAFEEIGLLYRDENGDRVIA